MKRSSLAAVIVVLGVASLGAAPAVERRGGGEFWDGVRVAIERNLGRPYVWGATGLKSFDCSGFVWRVLAENGLLVKRTTARKYYMSLPRVSGDKWAFGNIVFFDNLKHCGIVDTRDTFYHAQSSLGTNRSRFDPFWRPKVCGFRAPAKPAMAPAPGK